MSHFYGGVHPAMHKTLTSDKPIKRAFIPRRVVLPLSQHVGAPAVPVVKVGDTVVLTTTYGEFTYTVREIKILEQGSFSEITKDNGVEQLTLYTCYPFVYIGNAPDRYAVFCDLKEAVLNS